MTESKLSELEAPLASAKAQVKLHAERGITIDAAGPWAEQILGETEPEAESIRVVAFHEAGHFEVARVLGVPMVAIRMRLYADGRLHGLVTPDWASIDLQPDLCDGRNAGARLRGSRSVGMPLDLDALILRAEQIVRTHWDRIRRIGDHVANLCHSQTGDEWRVVVSAETIERLFWTDEQWRTAYPGMMESES